VFLTAVLAVVVVILGWAVVWLWWKWQQECRRYNELSDLYAALTIDHHALVREHNEIANGVAFADPWPEWDPGRVDLPDPS
jgi:hypothetical protein